MKISRRHAVAATSAALIGQAVGAKAQTAPASSGNAMNISNGTNASRKGPPEYFTGSVRVDTPFTTSAPARVGGAFVTFEPGARTAWHTHPLGQTLIVTAGRGWVQAEGAAREDVQPGDVVWFPPGARHWHGATATHGMTHIAIAEALDGKTVDWMEKVTDEQYGT